MIPVSKTLETDIAVVGGGIGGLCAAIAAAEGGARGMAGSYTQLRDHETLVESACRLLVGKR